jgi:hypothetical protein
MPPPISKATAFIMYKLQFLFLSIRHVKLAHMKGWDLLPSAAEIIFTCIFLQLVLNAGILLSDGDTGYHIRAGEFIINARTVPKTDIFSLWIPPLQWTAHEWLSEVLMAVVHHHAGLTGIVIFFSLTIAASFVLLFKMLRAESHDVLLSLLLTVVAATTSSIHWLARPHIFSLILAVIWYSVLNRFQYRGKNQLFLLPVIMLLWVNLHGGYIFGLILLLIYLLGNLAALCFNDRSARHEHIDKLKSFAKVLAASLLASLCNPQGYRILVFPFSLASDPFLMNNVREFLSPNFHEPLTFKYLLLGSIALFAVSRVALNWIELGLVILTTYMALYSARYIPLYAIITAPILLRMVDRLKYDLPHNGVNWLSRRTRNFTLLDLRSIGYLWLTGGIMVVLTLAHMGRLHTDFDEKIFPTKAVDFIMAENVSGNIFNNEEFGDYIIYKAWPKYRVFFDGRSDMYGAALGGEYLKVARTLPGWQNVLQKHQIDWVFFNTGSILSSLLNTNPNWHLIYSDPVASIFVRDKPQYQHLIAKYAPKS